MRSESKSHIPVIKYSKMVPEQDVSVHLRSVAKVGLNAPDTHWSLDVSSADMLVG